MHLLDNHIIEHIGSESDLFLITFSMIKLKHLTWKTNEMAFYRFEMVSSTVYPITFTII